MTALSTPQSLPAQPAWISVLVLVPALLAMSASGAAFAVGRMPVGTAWRLARGATAAMVAVAVALAAVRVVVGTGADGVVRLDDVTVALLLLITVVGAVVVRYSSTYLGGDPSQRRYVVRMLATLAAVATVVVANHLVLLVAAWSAASMTLHGLLTHFSDRPVALAVAHKKFLLARIADACMVGAVVAFATSASSLRIDEIVRRSVADGMPAGARLGLLLVALAAVLKCAQLPFHGWLIQVMEAPTPVSALLHAGVVNLGGVVLLRFAPAVDGAVEARTLLVVIGVLTAVIASLVMTTRVSVKVALAWSTCAQMGFMLMQCGLGIWEMALLHLLAHSLYKAHAFLGAGGTVRATQRRQLAPATTPPTLRPVLAGTLVAVAGTAVVSVAWASLPGTAPLWAGAWVLLGVVALSLVPLAAPFPVAMGGLVARAFAVPLAYLVLHELAGHLVPHANHTPAALLVFAAVGFAALFVAQTGCLVAPRGRLARRVLPWVYAGLFLDESFTRVAFRLRRPPAATSRSSHLPQPTVVLAFSTDRTH